MKILILWDDSGEFTYADNLSKELLVRLGDFVHTYNSHVVKNVTYHVYKHGTVRFL